MGVDYLIYNTRSRSRRYAPVVQGYSHFALPFSPGPALEYRTGSAARIPRNPARLHLAFAPIFADVPGLFEIRIAFARLDGGFLWIGAELVGDFFGFRFHAIN